MIEFFAGYASQDCKILGIKKGFNSEVQISIENSPLLKNLFGLLKFVDP